MPAKTEREKMLAGELYVAADPELVAGRLRARRLTKQYNESAPDELDRRRAILRELFGAIGPRFEIEPPFRCDYGSNLEIGDNFYANFNCVILDCAMVRIGRNVQLGPNVQIYTATHPLNAAERNRGPELARPITIEDDVWIGGGAIINPGATIGRGSTVGAGSVVTRDIPPGVFAAGNPCRVMRAIG